MRGCTPRVQLFLLPHGPRQPAALFGFPGLDLGPLPEVLGGLHHIAISVTPEKWSALRRNLDAAGVPVPGTLDEDNAVRVAIAVLHAAGYGGRSVLVTRGSRR